MFKDPESGATSWCTFFLTFAGTAIGPALVFFLLLVSPIPNDFVVFALFSLPILIPLGLLAGAFAGFRLGTWLTTH